MRVLSARRGGRRLACTCQWQMYTIVTIHIDEARGQALLNQEAPWFKGHQHYGSVLGLASLRLSPSAVSQVQTTKKPNGNAAYCTNLGPAG